MPRTSRRSVVRTCAGALLALGLVSGCAQEEPVDQVGPTTSAPTVDDSPTTSGDDAAVTSDGDAATTTEPVTDDAAATSEEPVRQLTLSAVDGGFEATLPAGWDDAIDLVDDPAVQLAGRASEDVDGFFPNVLVTREEYVSNLTSAVEEAAEELAGEDGEYELLEPAEVDGNRAPGYTIVREVQGRTLHQTQRWISHDGTLYVVTLSAPQEQAEDAAPLLDDMLASWTWTD